MEFFQWPSQTSFTLAKVCSILGYCYHLFLFLFSLYTIIVKHFISGKCERIFIAFMCNAVSALKGVPSYSVCRQCRRRLNPSACAISMAQLFVILCTQVTLTDLRHLVHKTLKYQSSQSIIFIIACTLSCSEVAVHFFCFLTTAVLIINQSSSKQTENILYFSVVQRQTTAA